jgi:RHS repeat-associated protein
MLDEPASSPPRRRPPYGIYAYTGREWDPEVGLYFYRARYYDPKVGRFISEDPAGRANGPNLYAYVENSPVDLIDPTGMVSAVAFPYWMKHQGERMARAVDYVEK